MNKIYVINMPESTDRLNNIKMQLNYASIDNYEIVPGFDVNSILLEDLKVIFDFEKMPKRRFTDGPMLKGEIGCTIAHWNLWKKIADSGQVSVVLEDDVKLKKDFKEWSNNIINNMRHDEPWVVVTSTNGVIKKQSYSKVLDSVYPCCYCWGTWCYIISPEAAKKLTSRKPWTLADYWHVYQKEVGIKVYVEEDGHVIHKWTMENSIVGRNPWNAEWPLYKKIIVALRNIFVRDKYYIWLKGGRNINAPNIQLDTK